MYYVCNLLKTPTKI